MSLSIRDFSVAIDENGHFQKEVQPMKKKKFVSSVAKMRVIMPSDPKFRKFHLSKENKNTEDTCCDTNTLHQNPNQN